MDEIAVLIPCYNEEKTIIKVVDDIKKALPQAKIYVYNNNSTDRTAEFAKKAGAIVKNEFMQGKGNVIRTMFREIDAKCYVMIDGDDTYPAEAAKKMAQLILNKNADMVIGDRLSSTYFTQNKRPFHNLGNRLVRKSINYLFHSNIKDIMTGYRAFSYEFVKTFPVLSKGFEIETEMSVHAVDKNMHIENVIIDYRDRPTDSQSKLNTYSDGLKVIKTIIKLHMTYKPLKFFGMITFVLAAISIIFFIPIANQYLKTGLVPHFPTLIVCCFTMIAAIQSFFAGLQLQTMVQKNRQDFEINLIKVADKKKLLTNISASFPQNLTKL